MLRDDAAMLNQKPLSVRIIASAHRAEIAAFAAPASPTCAGQIIRFTLDSDRESGPRQDVMSALPSQADMCAARGDVCLGPIADIARHSIS